MAPRIPRTIGREAVLKQSSRAPLLDFEQKLTTMAVNLFAEYADLGVLPPPDKLGALAEIVIQDIATEAAAKVAKKP